MRDRPGAGKAQVSGPPARPSGRARSSVEEHSPYKRGVAGSNPAAPTSLHVLTYEIQHQRGLARMGEAGVERNHCKGLAFEWMHTVEQAIDTFATAADGLSAVGGQL